ncbi:hypothetical protein FRX31_014114 [Thalictrum thalictroides]|uniref:Uncharacterized protein n=1 Tax=Thalictrum thalictroides TaxID=46969 RepID=A0A7J6WFZ3_THATH|nr:hypothetical protein FRX31_014114 [Thalictrum thalictroides]
MIAARPIYSSKKLGIEPEKMNEACSDETIVFKFEDSDIVGNSEAGTYHRHRRIHLTKKSPHLVRRSTYIHIFFQWEPGKRRYKLLGIITECKACNAGSFGTHLYSLF